MRLCDKPYTLIQTLPKFKSLNKLIEFFDTHDLGEYWDEMPESNFEVGLKERRILTIFSQALVNDWLKEKIMQQG